MKSAIVTCASLPADASTDTAYKLTPISPDETYYRARTDRNLGWITPEEQEMLRGSVIGIAGCGGMGGMLASTFVRLGVGEVRIADSEVFDTSNINRQYAAGRSTVGKSKALETARMTRDVSDDTTLVVYPQGIQEDTVDAFVDGCDVICDEIEFWAIGSRILLHRQARQHGICLYNCSTVGFGTRLFYFEPKGCRMEDLLSYEYEAAKILQERIQNRTASRDEVHAVMEAVLGGLIPELPEYSGDTSSSSTVREGRRRLFQEGRAMIISTNPPMASGFLGDHVLFHLLRTKSKVPRVLREPVPAPGYLYFDAGFHTAKAIHREKV